MQKIFERLRQGFTLDLRALALLRFGSGLILVVDLLYRLRYLHDFFTDEGVVPRVAVFEWNDLLLSLHFISGRAEFQWILFLAAIFFAVTMALGYRTRVSTIISWILLVSLHNRNLFILQGGDDYLRMILFWGIFLPWGRVWSLDGLNKPAVQRFEHFSIAGVALIVQVMLLYFTATMYRKSPEWWQEGSAIYYALSLDQFTRSAGYWIYQFPGLLKGLTYFVIYLELIGPFLLIFPIKNHWTRTTAIILLALLHIGIGITMMIGIFSWIGTVVLIGLLPAAVMERLEMFGKKVIPPNFIDKVTSKLESLFNRLWSRPAQNNRKPSTTRFDYWYRQAFLAFTFLFVLLWNVEQVAGKTDIIPPRLKGFAGFLRIDQSWRMFSPDIQKTDGWYIMRGILNDSTEADLFHDSDTLTWNRPNSIRKTYKCARWRKYLENWYANPSIRKYLPIYLVKKWNASHPEEKHVKFVEIIFMREYNLPGYEHTDPEPVVMFTYDPKNNDCLDK